MSQISKSSGGSSSGGMVFLGTRTASASALLEFKSLITSAYRYYELKCYNVVVDSVPLVTLKMQVSNDNGATYLAAGYDSMAATINSAGGVFSSSTSTEFILFAFINNSAPSNAEFTFNSFATSTQSSITGVGYINNGIASVETLGGMGPANVNAFKIFSTVNITSGTFDLYGIV